MAPGPKIDISPGDLKIVLDILERHVPDREVWAFGSRATWKAKEYSDLDLAVIGDEPLGYKLLGALKDDFAESDLPFKVDVVDWATTSESFREIIRRDRVVVRDGSVRSATIRGFRSDTAFAWPLVKMEEVVTLHYGKALTDTNRRPGNVPVYGTNGRTGWHDVHLATGPTVILGRKGMGNLGIEWCPNPFWVIDTAYYTSFSTKIDPKFFYYFTRFVGLNHLKDGTSNPSLTRDMFSCQTIPLPPLDEQRNISAIFSRLDDKIDLNRRMNETLEAMARALFKSWFVDFDPVRAKIEGRQPDGMDAATAALFPSSFSTDADEELPCGWTNSPLDQIADFLNGAAMQKHPATDDSWLPVIKIAELRQGVTVNTDRATPAIPEKYLVRDGDVLFSWSGSLMLKVWSGGNGALNQHLFKVTSEQYRKWFFYLWIEFHLPWFQHIAASKATTMGHIQRQHLTEANVVVPDAPLMNAADALIGPLFDKMLAHDLEARTLATLRDLLLPKLLSGQLRIKDAEKAVEAAL
jgi:type I restriction enzyme S subunit